ncbi:MAG: LmbE family protein [Verrucomicrobia bacterium]|nr:LmbE family protein [Verrucomicrobiota bacterium]
MPPPAGSGRGLRARGWARALLILALLGGRPAGAASQPLGAADILQELRSFRNTGSVLYVAAHPDDENNRLLPYLARGRGLRTGYLSLTRGDGGQNLIGPELGPLLGVIRTQELLAARRIDGARQFFTRAKDFGFSKDAADTLQRWDRQQVLADIVRVVRTFRPDVMITRFSPIPGGTHGHHTASAILAIEAFKLAGDPAAFPDQIAAGLAAWQPRRLVWNSFNRANFGPDTTPGVLRLEANGFDALLGESFGEIGARGRSLHKSQGEGRLGTRGSSIETFEQVAGEPATGDLMDGVDLTWARVPGGGGIDAAVATIVAHFDPQDPAASVPALLDVRSRVAALPADPLVADKRIQLDRILQACLGLFVDSTIPQAQVVPGEKLTLRHTAIARTGFPVKWIGVRYPGLSSVTQGEPVGLVNNVSSSRDATPAVPADAPLSQPYWLQEKGTDGMFRVDDPALIGRPENPAAFPVEQIFEVGGQTLVIADEPVQVVADPVRGEIRRPLEVIAPVSVNWTKSLELVAPGATRSVAVEVIASRGDARGTLTPELPAGWSVSPASRDFALAAAGERASFSFDVTAPAAPATAVITARAAIGARGHHRSRAEIRYDHIPAQLLQFSAELKLVALDVVTRSRKIAYLPGAGDDVADGLRELGCTVTEISGADLTPEKLRAFDAVVVGVRAFNTRTDLMPRLPALYAWVETGGTVVIQYNRPGRDLRTENLTPLHLRIADLRVTDETAPMTILAPDHPALNAPNRITSADFDGWVQERGAYFPAEWDPRFVPLLASNDPGEASLRGGLLVAPYGRGHIVYTGLAFFRQLPAGVPGAYRLLANLISLGK